MDNKHRKNSGEGVSATELTVAKNKNLAFPTQAEHYYFLSILG